MTQQTSTGEPLRVVIVGGGVAALEGALAIHELAGEHAHTTVIAPNREFVYRPLAVREPFARSGAARYPLAPIIAAAHASHRVSSLRWVDRFAQTVHTSSGEAVPYDQLVLALGARVYPPFRHALTLDPDRLDSQLHGIVQDIEQGYVTRLALVIPPGRSWPLPIYELALMMAARAESLCAALDVTIVSPESRPLQVFGPAASDAVARRLEEAGVAFSGSAYPRVTGPGQISLGGRREISSDRIIALPSLHGCPVPGMPSGNASRGFIAVDPHCRVRHVQAVFAAGDITDYPVKQGGIAAQQALTAAEEIAGLAGVATTASPFEPVLHGALLSGHQPLYLRARLTVGGTPSTSQASLRPLWDSADKIHTRYLTPQLARLVAGRDLSVKALAHTA